MPLILIHDEHALLWGPGLGVQQYSSGSAVVALRLSQVSG
jgi:hypothetical protein